MSKEIFRKLLLRNTCSRLIFKFEGPGKQWVYCKLKKTNISIEIKQATIKIVEMHVMHKAQRLIKHI